MSFNRRGRFRIAAAINLFAAVLTACATLPPPGGGSDDAAYTAGASTLIARLTLEADTTTARFTTEQPLPGQTAPPKQRRTATPSPPTPTPMATQPPSPPSETAVPLESPTSAPPVQACNRMSILGDVNLWPDSTVQAGAGFTKVWRVQNTGSCTWTPGYALVYTGGGLIPFSPAPPAAQSLAGPAPPGSIIDLAISLAAPTIPGVYQGEWMLRSDAGEIFGGGENGRTPLFARLQVLQPQVSRDLIYDVGANYCFGEWRSAAGRLRCPGNPGDRDGSVVYTESARLESRPGAANILRTHPNRAADGWIQGKTEPILISTRDHFITEIGCLSGSPECDVIFELSYITTAGESGRLGRWRETYDGASTYIDVDLSFLAGRNTSLVLTVYNQGRPGDADAYWLEPQVRPAQARPDTLIWTREGTPFAASCQELRIFHTGTVGAVAVASNCEAGTFELGRTTLSADQFSQLRQWERRLADFEGEMYTAAGGRPIISWIVFRGIGSGIATEPDMRALALFAEQLYQTITR